LKNSANFFKNGERIFQHFEENIMGFNPFNRRQSGGHGKPPQTVVTEEPDTTSKDYHSSNSAADESSGNLASYSPDRIIADVAADAATISFGLTGSQRYKHGIGDTWANIAPWVLCVGTVFEVALFLITHMNMAVWDEYHIATWIVMLVIFAGIISLEATFATVSLKTAAIRQGGRDRVNGPTADDKTLLRNHMIMWIVLALTVSAGQVAFLVGDAALGSSMITTILFVLYSVIRVVGTMCGDAYTAFIHVEGPSDAERLVAAREKRADFIQKGLRQRNAEVNIVNEQVQINMRSQAKGEIELDGLRTELIIKKEENQTRIETMRQQAENARLISKMGNNMMQSFFDPDMPDDQRQRVFRSLQGLTQAYKELPPPRDNEDV
jgi:hypothetical protein